MRIMIRTPLLNITEKLSLFFFLEILFKKEKKRDSDFLQKQYSNYSG